MHGYPDTHRVWDELIDVLSDRFHVITYDVRGMGASTAGAGGFALATLVEDLEAVIDAFEPDRAVHLVGHDWGAFQCWAAVAEPRLRTRVASFTAIAGPRLDATPAWIRRRLRASRAAIAQLASQARRSWYVGAFMIPRLPEAALRRWMNSTWPRVMRRAEGIEPRPGHPAATLAADARVGLELYRTNMLRPSRTSVGPVEVPVQLIVALRDRYISPALYEECSTWARDIRRHDIDRGHWLQRSDPEEVAAVICSHVARAGAQPVSSAYGAG